MLTARWDITSYCNLRCIHCRSEEFYALDKQVYPTLDQALAIVDALVDKGVKAINILGGEPFAYKHLMEVLGYAVTQNLAVYITTNAILLRDEHVSEVVGLGLKQITISLDGSCPSINDAIRGPDVFEKTAHKLQLIIKEKRKIVQQLSTHNLPTVSVNCVLTKINRSDVGRLLKYCADIGVDSFRLSPLDCMGRAKDYTNALWLTPEEQLDTAEELALLTERYRDLEVQILDLKPLVLEYIYEKTNISLPVSVVGCAACTGELYIQPGGVASPCLATAKTADFVTRGLVRDYTRHLSQLRNLRKGQGFLDFQRDFTRNRGSYRQYIPCNECHYAGNLCKPCPLKSTLPGLHLEKMCYVANRRLADLRAADLKTVTQTGTHK